MAYVFFTLRRVLLLIVGKVAKMKSVLNPCFSDCSYILCFLDCKLLACKLLLLLKTDALFLQLFL